MIEAPGLSLLPWEIALQEDELGLLWSVVSNICVPLSDTGGVKQA